MNFFKYILVILLTQNIVFASQIPSNWYSLNDDKDNLQFSSTEKGLEKFDKYVDQILNLQENVLTDFSENKFLGDWKFSGMKTDLSISKSGLFGITALKAETAVELTWKNKTVAKQRKLETFNNVVKLSSDMGEDEIMAQLDSLIDYGVRSGKVKNESKLRENLKQKVLEVHSLMKQVEQVNTQAWVPSAFRMDLSFGVSGNIFSFSELGGDFRVRLDWKIKQSSSASNNKQEPNKKEKKFKKLLSKISADLTEAAEKVEQTSSYKLDKVAFGFGASKKTIFSIAKSKASAVGLLFFKKTGNKSGIKELDLEGDYEFAEEGDNKLFTGFFTRAKFRKSLKKSFKISDYFAKKAEARKSYWVIEKVKTQFALSYSGIFGLTGASGKTIAEVYFKKGVK